MRKGVNEVTKYGQLLKSNPNYNHLISYNSKEHDYYYDEILSLVDSGILCNNKINYDEIDFYLKSSSITLLLVEYPESDSGVDQSIPLYGNVIGFALATFIPREGGYCKLDILCGSGGSGSRLLQLLTEIVFNLQLQKIKLNSIPSAVGFYIGKGFRIINQIRDDTVMEKQLIGGNYSKYKKIKKNKTIKNIKQIKS